MGPRTGGRKTGEISPQLTAFFTSALIFASSAAVNSFSAKATGHRAPSSRLALSLKPNVAYLVLNFCALWKKQTTLPSLAYAGIPYQSFGERAGALALTIAWSRSAMARSGAFMAAIFSSTALSPSALSVRGRGRAPDVVRLEDEASHGTLGDQLAELRGGGFVVHRRAGLFQGDFGAGVVGDAHRQPAVGTLLDVLAFLQPYLVDVEVEGLVLVEDHDGSGV